MSELTQDRLKELLHYNPDTGDWIWISCGMKGRWPAGREAGYTRPDGYLCIRVDKKLYLAHRLAWLYMEGYFPENTIDHINRIKRDSRWTNLRHVTQQCNAINCKNLKSNKSGVKGVFFDIKYNRWRSYIERDGKRKYLGSFQDKLSAVRSRWEAEKKHILYDCCPLSTAHNCLKEAGIL